MVLTVTVGQLLIMGVLLRRHVEFDLKAWAKQASPKRKLFALCTYLFCVGCFMWTQFRDTNVGSLDASSIAGLVVGGVFAIGLFALVGWASKRAIQKHQAINQAGESGE